MKKIFFLFLPIILLLVNLPTRAQGVSPISKDANLSLFSGYFAKQQNANNKGYWYGAYGDMPLIKSQENDWNLGLYGLYAKSVWMDNLAPYRASTDAVSLGLNTGYYNEYFSYRHTMYLGFSLGYKYLQEVGEVDKLDYKSRSVQQDHGLAGSVNFNLLKYSGYHERLFPRLQVIFTAEKYFKTIKVLNENETVNIKTVPWQKDYYEVMLKQSIADIPTSYTSAVFIQPKIGVQYSHYMAGDPDSYGLLLELSLHKEHQDDFLSVSVMQKWNSSGDAIYIAMISMNLMKFTNK